MSALLNGLPPGCALHRDVLGESWTNETALLAIIADRLGVIATGGKYGLKEVPEPIPRPGGLQQTEVVTDPGAIASFFGGSA